MDQIIKILDAVGASDAEKKAEILEKYKEEILKWNDKVNLTTITKDDFDMKHYADSLSLAGEAFIKDANKIIDVGTGAGFPGVPLAVMYPDKEFTVMDSLNKRIKIITETVDKLGITNLAAVHGRAEELARMNGYREAYDLCVSRAVANMSTLSEYCLPFVKKGGYFVAYKGPDPVDEIEKAGHAIPILGGGKPLIEKPFLNGKIEGYDTDHTIVIIKKEKGTPKKYPRKAGTPSRDPLK